MKLIIIAGFLLASVATSYCQGDSFDSFFHSSQKAQAAPEVMKLEGTIARQIRNALYVVDVDADCAEKYGFGRSHDDPSFVRGTNDTVIVEHNAVLEEVRVVLWGEPQERNDVTISCWVVRNGTYRYSTTTGNSEILQAFKVCDAPTPATSGTQK